jgi:hypothetical protein
MRGLSWRRETAKERGRERSNGRVRATGCSAGGADRLAPPHADMSYPPDPTAWFRIRRARLLSLVGRRVSFPSTRARRMRQPLPACLDFTMSYPPDSKSPNRIGRLRRCPNSDISYKLMLHLIMLKKSAIKKKFARTWTEETGEQISLKYSTIRSHSAKRP